MDLLNFVVEWSEWFANRPDAVKKDGALRFGILGAAKIGLVFARVGLKFERKINFSTAQQR
jgi:hypothetical protein